MHAILLLFLSKAAAATYFILNRVAGWSSALYLWRRGKRTGQKRFYVFAGVVYAVSWLLIGEIFHAIVYLSSKVK